MKNKKYKFIYSIASAATVVMAGTTAIEARQIKVVKSMIYQLNPESDALQDEVLRGNLSQDMVYGTINEGIDSLSTQSIGEPHVHDATKSSKVEAKPFNPPPQFQGTQGFVSDFWKLLGY